VIGYEEDFVLPDQDFDLIYSFSKEEIGLNLLTYPDLSGMNGTSREGYFLLMAAPSVESNQIVPRDIILVLDTSGSMEGEKLSQAKEASKYVLSHLNQEDRFNVVAFSTGIKRFAHNLQPASRASEAILWIDRMSALGGTNINLALLEALSLRSDLVDGGRGRPMVVLFLTDGLPTEGITDIQQIIANIQAIASSSVRLFTFGVGDDVNTVLLDTLAADNRGLSSYVRPQERIDEEVSILYAKIKTPVLTDLVLDFGGILVDEIYPPDIPDLFLGTQLLLTGRYRLPAGNSGQTKIELSGYVNDDKKSFVYEADFVPDDMAGKSTSYIPRLWATRKIGYLLSQIRLRGENQEWVDAIVQLSIQYGVITPYTSFLIEESDFLTEEGLDEAAHDLMAEYSGPAVGADAVEKADAESNLRSAESFYQSDLLSGEYNNGIPQPVVKYVEDKTFLYQNGVWIDTIYKPGSMKTLKIGFGTQVYFDLLKSRPSFGKYLALGNQLIFVKSGFAYEIVEGEGELENLPSQLSQPEGDTKSNQGEKLPDLSALQQPFKPLRDFCVVPFLIGLAVLGYGKNK
jgi:Ca-activated chloride channel family protein